jgi:hypothetical protein
MIPSRSDRKDAVLVAPIDGNSSKLTEPLDTSAHGLKVVAEGDQPVVE